MSGSSSSGVDKAYNSRMAELAEMASSQSLLSEHERKYGFRPDGFQAQIDKQVYTTGQDADGNTVPVINRKALSGTGITTTGTTTNTSPPVTSAAGMLEKQKMTDPLGNLKKNMDWLDGVGGA